MTKFAWNPESAAFFVAGYTTCLVAEGKALANSGEFITSLMSLYAEKHEGVMPVSVRSVRQKLASEKVYQKEDPAEKAKAARPAKGKKINQVAKIAESIAKITGDDESHVFETFASLEGATAKCLAQLLSVMTESKLLPVEDDGSSGE